MSEQSRVAVVTDSTAYLPAELVRVSGVEVVPLQVVIGGTSYDEVDQASSGTVADALRRWQPVTTSLQVGMTGSTRDAAGRFILVSQAGHVLLSGDGGASFKLAKVERPVPAAAVAFAQNTLLIAGPRGVHARPLP